MFTVDITVTNDTGLHTRPGNELVKLIKGFEDSIIHVEKGDKKVKASSLLQIMSLAVKKGDVVKVHIEGGNEEQVATALKDFFANLKD
ncbi:MAG: HPr family phosphocarrier protein [Brevinemataceae bacterium]